MASSVAYDPRIHRELWHNDNPFVLVTRARQRKCRGCGHRLDDRYIIVHEEHRQFWQNGCRRITSEKTHYHCNVSCIVPRHPYFKAAEVTAPPTVALRLVKERVLCCGDIRLSFMRPSQSFFCQRCIYSTDVVYQQLELHAADICNSVQSTCDVHVA